MHVELLCILLFLWCGVTSSEYLYSQTKTQGFRSVRFVSEKVGFIAGPQSVFCSQDGGDTWKAISLGSNGSPSRIDFHEGSPLFHQVGNIIWADPDMALIRGAETLLIARIQSGSTEKVISSDQTYRSLQRISFLNRNDGWGISNGGAVYRTNDGGKTWKYVGCGAHRSEKAEQDSTPFGFRLINGIKALSSLELLAVNVSGEIYHTIDGGCHWEQGQVGIPHEVRGIIGLGFFDDRSGWIWSLNS